MKKETQISILNLLLIFIVVMSLHLYFNIPEWYRYIFAFMGWGLIGYFWDSDKIVRLTNEGRRN